MGSGSSKSRSSSRASGVVKTDEKSKEAAGTTTHNVLTLEPRDVMISYSHADKDMMIKIRDSLEANDITVWVDVVGLKAGVDFLAKIGQAIIDAKMVISLLSEKTIESKYCQDELALAYVSHKPIFPVAIKPPGELFPKMDTGMKLQLARFDWHLFTDETQYENNIKDLVNAMRQQKASLEEKENDTELRSHLPGDNKNGSKSEKKRFTQQKSFLTEYAAGEYPQFDDTSSEQFWTNHFKDESKVSWDSFMDVFKKDFEKGISVLFNQEGNYAFLEEILRRELKVDENDGFVTKDSFTEFCTVEGETIPLWHKVQDQFIESYTMREVFNMESSVRVEAIENLGKFRSKTVIEALKDLLTDQDDNVRAVAAISLARTGSHDKEVIKRLMKCLSDPDRLVRESGILALGHLKAEQAVSKIVHLWRNDFISSVREAAQVALEQIGGDEANKAMLMTKVLSEEIRMLTKD